MPKNSRALNINKNAGQYTKTQQLAIHWNRMMEQD
jgi:hypothetical protein